MPALIGDLVDELLAEPVLLVLQVETGQSHKELVDWRALLLATLERLRNPVELRKQVFADRVHDVVGVSLHHAHRRLHLIENRPLLGRHHGFDPGQL